MKAAFLRLVSAGACSWLVGRVGDRWMVGVEGFEGAGAVTFFDRSGVLPDFVGAEERVSGVFVAGWLQGVGQVVAFVRRVQVLVGVAPRSEILLGDRVDVDFAEPGRVLITPVVPSKGFADPDGLAKILVRTVWMCGEVDGPAWGVEARRASSLICAEDIHGDAFFSFSEDAPEYALSLKIVDFFRRLSAVPDAASRASDLPGVMSPAQADPVVFSPGADMVSPIVAGGQALHATMVRSPIAVGVPGGGDVEMSFFAALVSSAAVSGRQERIGLFLRGIGPRVLGLVDTARPGVAPGGVVAGSGRGAG